jgi:hypothetical protein
MVGGVDYEGELAAARLRIKRAQTADAAGRREQRRDDLEQFEGRLLALAVVGIIFALLLLFG